jgi:hypothetical protein
VNQLEAETSILKKWLTQWPALAATIVPAGVATILDNTVAAEPDPPAVWCTVQVDQNVAGRRQTLGKPARTTYAGTIYVQLNYPQVGAGDVDDGTLVLKQLAVKVVELLSEQQWDEGVGEDGVITYEAHVSSVGPDGRWWTLAISFPYEYTLITP